VTVLVTALLQDGSIVAAEPLESGHPVRTRVRREDDRRS
jgi:hypothetical protein